MVPSPMTMLRGAQSDGLDAADAMIERFGHQSPIPFIPLLLVDPVYQ